MILDREEREEEGGEWKKRFAIMGVTPKEGG